MALRRLLVIFYCAAVSLAAQIKRYPLDERTSYLITVGTDAPTTVVFPSAIGALDAVNVGANPEEAPPVLLAHSAGAAFFTVRALKPDAQAAVNVLVQGRAYALTFRAGTAVDRTVTFTERSVGEAAMPSRLSPARFLNLLDRAKAWPSLAEQYPAIAAQIERGAPGNVSETHGLRITTEAVLKFAEEDAIVLKLRLENPGRIDVHYRADRLGVRIGEAVYPVAITDASGVVPATSAVSVHAAVSGEPDGSRAALSLQNVFTLEIEPRR